MITVRVTIEHDTLMHLIEEHVSNILKANTVQVLGIKYIPTKDVHLAIEAEIQID